MIKQVISQEYCLGCNGCCRFSQQDSVWSPVLLQEEIEELLKKDFPPSLISGEKKIRAIPHPEQNNFICSFFVPEDNKCKIYAFRPLECQLYPFLVNRVDDKIFLALDLKCPFVKENLESQKFKEYIRYLTDLFNTPDAIKTVRRNPQIIQIYAGVLNLAELKF